MTFAVSIWFLAMKRMPYYYSYLRNGGKVVFVFFYEIDAILYRNGSERRKGATVAETVGDQDEWHPEIPDSGRGGQGKQGISRWVTSLDQISRNTLETGEATPGLHQWMGYLSLSKFKKSMRKSIDCYIVILELEF